MAALRASESETVELDDRFLFTEDRSRVMLNWEARHVVPAKSHSHGRSLKTELQRRASFSSLQGNKLGKTESTFIPFPKPMNLILVTRLHDSKSGFSFCQNWLRRPEAHR